MTRDQEAKLNSLIQNNLITSWKLQNVDENGNLNKTSKFCNSERLTLVFPNKQELLIETLCSGSSEDTCLFIQ